MTDIATELMTIFSAPTTPIVTIHPDGTITYGEGYEPDAAAIVFWEAIAHEGLMQWQRIAIDAGWTPPT